MTSKIAMAALTGLLASASLLGGCGQGAQTAASDGGDKYAGLDEAIRGWRDTIEATEPACRDKSKDKGCQSFEVACKGEQTIAPAEQAKGVSAKVVVAMQWQGWNPEKSEFEASPGFARFTKVGGDWKRQEAPRVNLNTCV